MNDIRNKIIALSGQPVTGKGTTTKALIKKLETQGYEKDNIHVISTGNEFRRYFNILINFIKSLDNKEQLEKISDTEEMKDLMSTLKRRMTLIDTISRLRTAGVDLSNFSIEQANNLNELEEIRTVVDNLIDEGIRKKGKEINSKERPDEIWIIDSRLAFHNIPEAFSVRLTTTPEIAAKRLFNDKNRGAEDSSYSSLKEAKEAREKRRIGEQERYKERYGVDLENPDNYDLIIDTSYATINDTADTMLKCLDYYMDGKPFVKTWTSPKTLLPMQGIRETAGMATYTLEDMKNIIDKKGYLPDKPIEIIEADGYKGIIEGHHRNFAVADLGKTLVPYVVIAKDDEKIPYGGGTARERISSIRMVDLFDHEPLFEGKGKDKHFSYDDIYPGIYDRLNERDKKKIEEIESR